MLPDNREAGSPLEAISIQRFGGRTTAQERVVTVAATRVTLLSNNPNRLSWHLINEGGNDARVSIDPTITFTTGWLIPQAGGLISMIYYDDGEACGYEVYGISNAAGTTIRIREVYRL